MRFAGRGVGGPRRDGARAKSPPKQPKSPLFRRSPIPDRNVQRVKRCNSVAAGPVADRRPS